MSIFADEIIVTHPFEINAEHSMWIGMARGKPLAVILLTPEFAMAVTKLHNGTSCISSLIVCEHSHDNLELGVVPALEPAMLSHSYSLAKPLSSRCVAC